MSEKTEKRIVELKEEDRKLLQSVIEVLKPQKPEAPTEKTEGHKTVADRMECKDCNPPEEYPRLKKVFLKVMGQKECKECGNVDREGEEYCSDCGEEYPAK